MRFELTHRYAAPVDEVAAAYADPALYEQFVGLPKLGPPEVLEHTVEGPRVHLRIRYRFIGQLAPAVTAVVRPERLTWVEDATHDLDAHTVSWRMIPDHYADRLQASGTFRFIAAPDDASATIRETEGELKVRALLVGGAVERAIVAGLKEHLDAEVTVVERFLASRG
ncbi:MAG: hypothetical protein JWN46_1166 [Acidimicrobiales bacterium]|nr:hypothetical protein [Acidimicrobiales bacterium]